MLICRFSFGIAQKLRQFSGIFDEEAEKNLQTFLDNPRKFRVKNSELIRMSSGNQVTGSVHTYEIQCHNLWTLPQPRRVLDSNLVL
jgi:hypothetical protein